MSTTISYEQGKYTLVSNDRCELKALRYGEPWRDFTGDKLIWYMFDHINALTNELLAMREAQSKPFVDTSKPIARPMLTVSYTVPMPVKEALKGGQKYFLAGEDPKPNEWVWRADDCDEPWLSEGRIYLTHEDAQAAIDARNAAYGEAMK